jgi:hypothetical protein
MEAKTLLRLIRDDIAHLEGITSEFLSDSLPASDEVELAIVRAKALLRELELLHKIAALNESTLTQAKLAKEPKIELPEHYNSEQEHFELFSSRNINDEQKTIVIPVYQDRLPDEVAQDNGVTVKDLENTIETPEVITNTAETEEHYSALVEPTESVDVAPADPVIGEEVVIENHSDLSESAVLDDSVPDKSIIIEEEVIDLITIESEPNETTIDSPQETNENKENENNDQQITIIEPKTVVESVVIPDIQDQSEEILAEEFKEEKKTLNEALGESHQMVNDILAHEKEEAGFQIIQLNSIWDGIGINDRFLFIRELFANSSAKFENTVNALDKLSTILDAVNYLKMNFKWNKTEASQKFLVLVKRRFIK